MTYREKSALATVLSLSLVYGLYAWRVLAGPPLSPFQAMAAMFAAAGASVVILVAAHVIMAVVKRPERADERDQAIDRRSAVTAYYALMTGGWLVLTLAVAGARQTDIAMAALGGMVFAEIVRYGAQVVLYRRGG